MGGSPNGDLAPLKVSTSDLPERDRLPFWRDFFSQKIVLANIDLVLANIDLLSTLPLRAEVTLYALPGMRIMWSDLSTPMRGERTQAMVSQGDDSISIIAKQDGLFTIRQRGLEVSPCAGGGFWSSACRTRLHSDVRGTLYGLLDASRHFSPARKRH